MDEGGEVREVVDDVQYQVEHSRALLDRGDRRVHGGQAGRGERPRVDGLLLGEEREKVRGFEECRGSLSISTGVGSNTYRPVDSG